VIGFDPTTSGSLDNDRSSALAGKVIERPIPALLQLSYT